MNVEKAINNEQLRRAASNYFQCLNLPRKSQILIVTDDLPLNYVPNMASDLSVRTSLAGEIGRLAEIDGHNILTMRYDGSRLPLKPTDEEKANLIEELKNCTATALDDLDCLGAVNKTTTIVYLGAQWSNRTGIYAAADEFGKTHKVLMAGSLGFTTGDCRVISELDSAKMKKIEEINEKFEKFFSDHPQGRFEVNTRGEDNKTYTLTLEYDTAKAPFRSDLGRFDGIHESHVGEFKNFKFINVPGGEIFGNPYPFKKTKGKFAAEGLVFTVKKGLVTKVELGNRKIEELDPSQQELIRLVNDEGKSLPFGELGIGFYKLFNYKSYKDSSILSHEKDGPHAGLGHGEETTKEEEEEINKLAGKFRHTDFVLDNPEITWFDLQRQKESVPFYPPPESSYG